MSQTDPSYSFETSLFGDDTWALEARKEWTREDGTVGRDVLLLDLDTEQRQTLDMQAEQLSTLQHTEGLETAMHAAEQLSVSNGFLDPDRDDPRLFAFGPDDPFATRLEQERIQALAGQNEAFIDTEEVPHIDVSDYPTMVRETVQEAEQRQQANAPLQGTEWFEATFDGFDQELLQPLDNTVNYAVVVQADEPWSFELAVEKYWREPNGTLGIQSQTLDTYDPNVNADEAEQKRDELMQVYDERGLEEMMHQAELTAMENGYLDGGRADPRLFTQGPPDRFETLAQQLENEINPFWNTEGEDVQVEVADTLIPYWELETLPVNDPQGQSLGHALHMVVYPDVMQNSDAAHDPTLREGEPFQMLEMAHFETIDDADDFGQDFKGYLVPGLMEGPELAQEVARLEGLPIEWKTLDGEDLKAYHNDDLTLTRDVEAWNLYDPNAEREARNGVEDPGSPLSFGEGWNTQLTSADLDL